MKTIFQGIVIIALANLLAGAGFVGWLLTSDRLSWDRVRQAREALSVTITAQEALREAQEVKKTADDAAAVEAAKAIKPPLTASEQLSARVEATQIDRERAARLKQEVASLQRRLSEHGDRLAAERADLDRQRKAFAVERVQAKSGSGTEQFQKALGILTALKPAAAKAMLMEIIRAGPAKTASGQAETALASGGSAAIDVEGAGAGEMSSATGAMAPLLTAIQYLNVMEERARSKIMAEFAKDDPALAAKLLESLRQHGTGSVAGPAGEVRAAASDGATP